MTMTKPSAGELAEKLFPNYSDCGVEVSCEPLRSAFIDGWQAALRSPPSSGKDWIGGNRPAGSFPDMSPPASDMSPPASGTWVRGALELAEDVLSRAPFSTQVWPNGMHPQEGITKIRKALASIGNAGALDPVTVEALIKRAEGCLNSRNSAYPSDVLRECIICLRTLLEQPAPANAQESSKPADYVEGLAKTIWLAGFERAFDRTPTDPWENLSESAKAPHRHTARKIVEAGFISSPPPVRPLERVAIIEECVCAMASVMGMDPKLAGGPIFHAYPVNAHKS